MTHFMTALVHAPFQKVQQIMHAPFQMTQIQLMHASFESNEIDYCILNLFFSSNCYFLQIQSFQVVVFFVIHFAQLCCRLQRQQMLAKHLISHCIMLFITRQYIMIVLMQSSWFCFISIRVKVPIFFYQREYNSQAHLRLGNFLIVFSK